MKKILISILFSINLIFAQNPSEGDLENFTQIFSLRSLENGIILSVFRDSKELLHQNWKLRELVLSPELKAKDKMANKVPFGYVQFVTPTQDDTCMAILPNGFFGAKSCSKDLEEGALETVFSIMPTTTSAVQIRSLVLNSNECIGTFFNPNVPIEKRFGLKRCTFDPFSVILPENLMILTPPLFKANVL
ncbi:cytolethal distending toxin subunit A [Campylobacter helveticus]|uniref:cytolethal distending toxin subunit A n=1 Tax=Campylobacter helveticus TaxID=28898 RepID=UPI00214A160A|nr:cytolethal distending toxin subunit A [Campylobacter helveticus]MCR2065372.1 cytolethal distending toxin subunit A [Campylobacter helveticus]